MIRFSPGVCRRVATLGVVSLWGLLIGCASHGNSTRPGSSGADISFSEPSRDLEPPSKLAPALQALASASETSRDLSPSDQGTAKVPSPDEVGYPAPGTTDVFEVAIHVAPEADVKAIAAAGRKISRCGWETLCMRRCMPAIWAQVGDVDGVRLVAPMPGGTIPMPPKVLLQASSREESSRDLDAGSGEAAKFDHRGLTARVIVGIVDTGIDWRHEDFMNPDGSPSRILYLWDIFDNSWEESKHTVGSKPPMTWDEGKPMGTVYIEECRSMRPSRGRSRSRERIRWATAPHAPAPPPRQWSGRSPRGRSGDRGHVYGRFQEPGQRRSVRSSGRGVDYADCLRSARAVRYRSLSFGGHDASHDGNGEQEEGFNQVVNGGEAKGVVICASAGNEGQDRMHARAFRLHNPE